MFEYYEFYFFLNCELGKLNSVYPVDIQLVGANFVRKN